MIALGICLKLKEMVLMNIKRTYSKCNFFDLDKNSKKDTNLPHMLVNLDHGEKIMSEIWDKK